MRKLVACLTTVAALAALGATRAPAATVPVTADITSSTGWTSNNVYVLTKVIYVTNGATLSIEPGTVVRGEAESSPGANDPGTLVITRGSKIQAAGTKLAPIVFTNLDDDNVGANPGTFPYDSAANALSITGTWGGVVLLGRGYVANNTAGAPNAAREVQIEGLVAAGGLGLYGNGGDDDDDSGTLQYVSIRYGGFNLSANNEINGLTLGAVGRETDLDSIEVFQNKDDGVEFFGGTAGISHLVVASPGDDSLDYDEGWRGRAQHVFVMQGTPGTDKSDKGGEHDGGNGPDGSLPFAIPTIYNATYVGLGQKTYTDKAKNTALHFRDNAGGRYYNSLFADFGGAPLLIEGGSTGGTSTDPLTSGARSIAAYSIDGVFHLGPPSAFQLELQDNCFWCFGNGGTIPTGDATASGGDTGKIHHDNGAFSNGALDNDYFGCATPLPIRSRVRTVVPIGTIPDPITSIDPRPAPGSALIGASDRTAPAGYGFAHAPYKGAFGTTNWAACWTNMSRLDYFPTCTGANNAVPDEVEGPYVAEKLVAGGVRLTFVAPSLPGCSGAQVFDTLRSTDPTDFTAPDCIESDDGADAEVTDPDVPADGECFFYLVRAENACGLGSLGLRSTGVERTGPDCP